MFIPPNAAIPSFRNYSAHQAPWWRGRQTIVPRGEQQKVEENLTSALKARISTPMWEKKYEIDSTYEYDTISLRHCCDTTRTLDITWHPLGQEVLDCLVQVASMKWRAVISVYVFWLTIISDAFVHCVFDWYERLVATISPPGWRSCSLNEHEDREYKWQIPKVTKGIVHCTVLCNMNCRTNMIICIGAMISPSCSVQC